MASESEPPAILPLDDFVAPAFGACRLLCYRSVQPELDIGQAAKEDLRWCRLKTLDFGLFKEWDGVSCPRVLLAETTFAHQNRRNLILAFRESKSLDDWADNLTATGSAYAAGQRKSRTPEAMEGFVVGQGHAGFLKRARKFPIRAIVDLLSTDEWNVIMTGYSQGSAVAEMFYSELVNRDAWRPAWASRVLVVGFGSPLCFDRKYSDFMLDGRVANSQLSYADLIHHFVFERDIVARALTIVGHIQRFAKKKIEGFSSFLKLSLGLSGFAEQAFGFLELAAHELAGEVFPEYHPVGHFHHLLRGGVMHSYSAKESIEQLQQTIFIPWFDEAGKPTISIDDLKAHGPDLYRNALQPHRQFRIGEDCSLELPSRLLEIVVKVDDIDARVVASQRELCVTVFGNNLPLISHVRITWDGVTYDDQKLFRVSTGVYRVRIFANVPTAASSSSSSSAAASSSTSPAVPRRGDAQPRITVHFFGLLEAQKEGFSRSAQLQQYQIDAHIKEMDPHKVLFLAGAQVAVLSRSHLDCTNTKLHDLIQVFRSLEEMNTAWREQLDSQVLVRIAQVIAASMIYDPSNSLLEQSKKFTDVCAAALWQFRLYHYSRSRIPAGTVGPHVPFTLSEDDHVPRSLVEFWLFPEPTAPLTAGQWYQQYQDIVFDKDLTEEQRLLRLTDFFSQAGFPPLLGIDEVLAMDLSAILVSVALLPYQILMMMSLWQVNQEHVYSPNALEASVNETLSGCFEMGVEDRGRWKSQKMVAKSSKLARILKKVFGSTDVMLSMDTYRRSLVLKLQDPLVTNQSCFALEQQLLRSHSTEQSVLVGFAQLRSLIVQQKILVVSGQQKMGKSWLCHTVFNGPRVDHSNTRDLIGWPMQHTENLLVIDTPAMNDLFRLNTLIVRLLWECASLGVLVTSVGAVNTPEFRNDLKNYRDKHAKCDSLIFATHADSLTEPVRPATEGTSRVERAAARRRGNAPRTASAFDPAQLGAAIQQKRSEVREQYRPALWFVSPRPLVLSAFRPECLTVFDVADAPTPDRFPEPSNPERAALQCTKILLPRAILTLCAHILRKNGVTAPTNMDNWLDVLKTLASNCVESAPEEDITIEDKWFELYQDLLPQHDEDE